MSADLLRHRRVPMRVCGDEAIVARPRDGAAVVMASTATVVWRSLDDWTTTAEIARRLAEAFPEVGESDRAAAQAEILQMLQDEELLESR
jgi:hypothetical protein